jgi:hypothetical protein
VAQVQAAVNSATVNELEVDGWRALVANRTLNLSAARAGLAECDAAVAAVRAAAAAREAAIRVLTVRATRRARRVRAARAQRKN